MDPFTGHRLGQPSFVRHAPPQAVQPKLPLEGTRPLRGLGHGPSQLPSGGLTPTEPALSAAVPAPSSTPLQIGSQELDGQLDVAPGSLPAAPAPRRPLTMTEVGLGARHSPEEPQETQQASFTMKELEAAMQRRDEVIAMMRQELRGGHKSWDELVERVRRR